MDKTATSHQDGGGMRILGEDFKPWQVALLAVVAVVAFLFVLGAMGAADMENQPKVQVANYTVVKPPCHGDACASWYLVQQRTMMCNTPYAVSQAIRAAANRQQAVVAGLGCFELPGQGMYGLRLFPTIEDYGYSSWKVSVDSMTGWVDAHALQRYGPPYPK